MIQAKMRNFALATPAQQGDTASFKVLAFSKFDFPGLNMTISGVALTWSAERGYCSMPPNAPVRNGDGLAVRWAYDSPMGLSLVDKMVHAFEAMGGKLPAPHTPASRLPFVDEGEPDNSGLLRVVGATA